MSVGYKSSFAVEDTLKHSNLKSTKACLQKADVLLSTADVNRATMSCQTDEKMLSEVSEIREGIRQAKKSFRSKGQSTEARSRNNTTSTEGNTITEGTHNSLRPKRFKNDMKTRVENRPGGYRQKLNNPFGMVNRLPSITLSTFHKGVQSKSLESLVNNDTDTSLDRSTDRNTLGKMYVDKQYLEFLVGSEEVAGAKTSVVKSTVTDTAEYGLMFLHEREKFWKSLGPLPPPQPSQRSGAKKKLNRLTTFASTVSLPSIEPVNTYSTHISTHNLDSRVARQCFSNMKSRVNSFREEQRVEKTEPPRPEKIKFIFKSYKKDEDIMEIAVIPEEGEDERKLEMEDEVRRRMENALRRGEEAATFLEQEILAIDKAFNQRKYSECEKKAMSCLDLLEHYTDEEVPSKHILQSMMYLSLGHCALQRKDNSKALEYYSLDLDIGVENGNLDIQSRALGNLGQVHIMMSNYNLALDAFNRKAPLCKTPLETAWLFHEIGNCFLMMKIFDYALKAGVKALEAAFEVNNTKFQLQSFVLIGVVEVNMKRYNEAYHHLEEALENAKMIEDQKSQDILNLALIDIKKKIVHQMKNKVSSRKCTYKMPTLRSYRVPPFVTI